MAGGSLFSASTSGNLAQVFAKLEKRVFDRVIEHRARIVLALTIKVLERTPVWEGETIVNWQWSINTPATGRLTEINNGPPGHTNSGGQPTPPSGEPRRGPNQDVAMQSAVTTLARARNSLADLYLTNNGTIAGLIEYGGAPTPETSRQPAGVLRIAIREIMAGIYE